ncbi:MAG: hypothetical protein WC325_07535 [Candidatus Bathyarchaeia archaeon]|jgi:hypothetical protein
MSQPRQIIVFGISDIKPIKLDNGEMFFEDIDSSHHLADYDICIYIAGTFRHCYEKNQFFQQVLKITPAEAIRREKEICSALEKGKTVCIIGSHAEDYVVQGLFKSNNINFYYTNNNEILRNLKIKKSQFKSFLDDVGATEMCFYEEHVDDAICYFNTTVVGFSKHIGKGLLLFLPFILGSNEISYLKEKIEKLVGGLISYSAKLVKETPEYIQQFQFTKEKGIRKEIDRITKEQIYPLEERLEFYNEIKSVLWLGDNYLVTATDNLLKKWVSKQISMRFMKKTFGLWKTMKKR